MPSPIGHALGALAAGWSAGGRADRRLAWRRAAWFAGLGVAPDLDLLIGRHGMETHSVGAALIVGAVAAWRQWPLAAGRARIFLAAALAWLSHPLLDALGHDTSVPIGIMLFWPLSTEHVSAIPIFDAISRRYWMPGFVERTVLAVGRELLILGPVTLAAWWLAGRRPSRAQS